MLIRKLDSDYRITQKLIRREVVKRLAETAPSTRNANFVRNYTFGGGGSGGFGGGGQAVGGTVTGLVYDPANPGTTYEQTRAKIEGARGVYLHDHPDADSILIVADVVNDPMFWLR